MIRTAGSEPHQRARPMAGRLLRRVNGPRGGFLLCMTVLCAAHVASCLSPGTSGVPLPVGLDVLEQTIPLPVYAALWATAGTLCVAGAFRSKHTRRTRVSADIAGFSALAGMLACWGVTYLLGWIFDADPSRQWVIALLYLAIAGGTAAAGRLVNPATGEER